MEDKKIPYIVYESLQVRSERQAKRLVIALVLTIALLFLSNLAWLHAWTQYDYEGTDTSYEQDGEGVNIIGDKNGVNNGAETGDKTAEKASEK